MDSKHIERIRAPGFPIARRGYEQRAVDNFLSSLADWLETDAATELGHVAVTRKLEMVGKSTAHILLTTERESEEMRRRAQKECADLRAEADAAALATRQAADEYAKKVREKAELDARRVSDAASARARQIVEEGERRRAQIEELVDELDRRRDGALAELERVEAEIASTLERHGRGGRREDARARGRRQSGGKQPVEGGEQQAERRPRQGRAAAPPSPR
jgi:vacuolar-type H+-ATPase subunit I/STV1